MKTTNSANVRTAAQTKVIKQAIVTTVKALKEAFLVANNIGAERQGLVADELQKTFARQLMLANGVGVEKDLKQAGELGKKFNVLLKSSTTKGQYDDIDNCVITLLIALAKVVSENTPKDAQKGPEQGKKGPKTEGKGQAGQKGPQAESEASKKERAERQAADKARREAQEKQARVAWDSLKNINLKEYSAILLEDVRPDDIISNDDLSQCYSVYDKGNRGIQIISFVSGSTVNYYSMTLEQFTFNPSTLHYDFTATDGTQYAFKFYRKIA